LRLARHVELDPGPRQQSYLLAILLARAGKSISTSELIDLIWGDRAPSSALNILQKYVCALRRLLDPPQWGIAYHWALLAEMWLAAGSHDRAEAALDRAVQTMRDYGLRYAEPPPNDSSQDRGPGPRRVPGSPRLRAVDLGSGVRKQVNTAPVDHGALYASRTTKVPCSFLHHPLSLPPLLRRPAWKPWTRVPHGIKSAAWSSSSSRSPIRAGCAGCATGSPRCWRWWSAR
jgi:hypothetical protein